MAGGGRGERRRHTRTDLAAPAVLNIPAGPDSTGRAWSGTAAAVSFGGAFFHNEGEEVPLDVPAEVVLHPPGAQPIRFTCRAVRAEAGGVGLRFLATDAEGLRRFSAWVLAGADAPDRLLDEMRVTPGFTVVTEMALRQALE